MRAVSYVERLEFDFPGSVFKNAFLFGDVDNDKSDELVVGNENGDVFIYKGNASKCWRRASDLGMVTAIGVGDIFNVGRNSLVVVNGEGWCYIFDFLIDTSNDGELPMKPTHVQRIPANTKVLLLHDVNSDGLIELVIGLTDRVVRTYQWINTKLVGLNKWEFANQIGTVAINDMANRAPSLLVAHPGGTFIRLKCKPLENCEEHDKEESRELLSKMSIDYHPLAYSHMRNPNVSTEILGNISQGMPHQDEHQGALYAVATLDGTLMMVRDEQILWSLQVDHQLFALSKLDITGDGREEVVACSWDGQTYIVNQEKQTVRFQFDQSVSAFTAGYYSLDSRAPSLPAFAYATFHNKIYLYYNVSLPRITLRTSSEILKEKSKNGGDTFMKSLTDTSKLSEMFSKILYQTQL
ncbi:KICSTOR complex protein ITFG2-like [Daphnia carinata]|uniref:KICSTOR complex protein ITFG2-like n=1 Tax=Daphnia carinata TaxID=120202 RepID=UPI00257B4CF2|nr:KICSTOR complex protein ITFG2-like [Daphnia carinata]